MIDKLAWALIVDRKLLFVRSEGEKLYFNAGGKRKGSETDKDALIREIREELSVKLIREKMFLDHEFHGSAHGTGEVLRIRCYRAPYMGVLTPSSEIEKMVWLTSKNKELTTSTGQDIIDFYHSQNRID